MKLNNKLLTLKVVLFWADDTSALVEDVVPRRYCNNLQEESEFVECYRPKDLFWMKERCPLIFAAMEHPKVFFEFLCDSSLIKSK